jgi:predicted P-loop ATPase
MLLDAGPSPSPADNLQPSDQHAGQGVARKIFYTLVASSRGPMAKVYDTDTEGQPKQTDDPSLSRGTVDRLALSPVGAMPALARRLGRMKQNEALICGDLTVPDTPRRLVMTWELPTNPDAVARNKNFFHYPIGRPALVMIDHDRKGLPADLQMRLDAEGGLLAVLTRICPEFAKAGVLMRPSSSTGIRNKTNGKTTTGGNVHLYLILKDGADAHDFVKRLHERLILDGWGWAFITKTGDIHIRSLIDVGASGSPSRLCFEADAKLAHPDLEHVPGARRCVVRDGDFLDTTKLPEPDDGERQRLVDIMARLRADAQPEADRIKGLRIAKRTAALVAQGRSPDEAKTRASQAYEKQRLDPTDPIRLDDGRDVTGADILRNPAAFHEATGADALEPDYGGGRNKAIWYTDRLPIKCFSQAHGGIVYELTWSAIDLIAAWEARRDKDEIAHMWTQTALDDPAADEAALAAAGVPPPPAELVFGRVVEDLALPTGKLGAPGTISPYWKKSLERTDRGRALASLVNAKVALGQGCGLDRHLHHDRATLQTVVTDVPPGSEVWTALSLDQARSIYEDPISGLPVFLWSDAMLTTARIHLQRDGVTVSKEHACDVIAHMAENNGFSSVAAYLRALTWDGVPRLDGWLVRHAGAADTLLHRACLTRWMTGAVARALQPEESGTAAKMDLVLTLVGPQGSRKSTFLQELCPVPQWHMENALGNLADKDAILRISGKWIIDFAEGATLKRNEAEHVKQFISTMYDTARVPYGRYPQQFQRRCVISMTLNPDNAGFLRDITGSRRFLIAETGRIDIDQLGRDRDQLWAEAVIEYRFNGRWWIDETDPQDKELAMAAAAAAESYRVYTDIEELLRRYLVDEPHLGQGGHLSWSRRPAALSVIGRLTDVLGELGIDMRRNQFAITEAQRALTAMKFERVRVKHRNGPIARDQLIWVDHDGAVAYHADKEGTGKTRGFRNWLVRAEKRQAIDRRSIPQSTPKTSNLGNAPELDTRPF